VRVGPEVVEVVPALDDCGDLVGGVEHLEDLCLQPLEALGSQGGDGLVVVAARPAQRVGGLDVLEPGVRVGGGRGHGTHPITHADGRAPAAGPGRAVGYSSPIFLSAASRAWSTLSEWEPPVFSSAKSEARS